jgi:hypothetical protein
MFAYSTLRCLFSRSILFATALSILLLPELSLGQQTRTTEVTSGLTLSYPSTWAPAKQQYQNAFNLVTPPDARTPDDLKAIINLTTETRRDHADALQELREMASGLPSAPRFLSIGGWPGFQARGLVPTTLEKQEEKEGYPLDSQGRPLVRRATTAIAVDNLLVRIEAVFTPRADSKLLDQVDAIGQRVQFRRTGGLTETARELQQLRSGPMPHSAPPPRNLPKSLQSEKPMPGRGTATVTGFGELEMAVSNNGQNIVIAGNSGIFFSLNSGQMFNAAQQGNICGSGGDRSVAWSPNGGENGTFYVSFLRDTTCMGANPNAIGVTTSTNSGQAFNLASNAVVAAVDQPHIAVDPRSAAGGSDQVYVVYKSEGGPLGTEQAAIVCSSNSGQAWSAPVAVGAMGDNYPRIAVGKDGIAYVISRAVMNGNVRIFPFTACASTPSLMPAPSWFVAVVNDDSMCPIAGLDRCGDGNTLQSWMVAVDDSDPNHIYAAYALPAAANTMAILVQDFMKTSPRGALAATGGPVRIDAGTAVQRFMPWVCSTGGAAFVSWYDRGATIGTMRKDLTDYVLGVALGRGSNLSAGPIINLSVNPDQQCNSGFPCGSRGNANAMACMVAPTPGGGCPKYGDYNGNACAAGRIYAAWASATAPPGLPRVNQITNFSTSTDAVALLPGPTLPFSPELYEALKWPSW